MDRLTGINWPQQKSQATEIDDSWQVGMARDVFESHTALVLSFNLFSPEALPQ